MPHIWYMSRLETGKGGGDGIRGGKGRARQAHTGPHTGTHRSRLVGPPALAVGPGDGAREGRAAEDDDALDPPCLLCRPQQ